MNGNAVLTKLLVAQLTSDEGRGRHRGVGGGWEVVALRLKNGSSLREVRPATRATARRCKIESLLPRVATVGAAWLGVAIERWFARS